MFPQAKDKTKMEKKWLSPFLKTGREGELSKALNISPKIGSLLIQRGIESYDQAFEFFRPSMQGLHDPFQMKGMKKAVERIHHAIIQNQKILLFGDYDVDGTTSVSLLFRYLISIYPHIQFYLPDRELEGYGVSMKGMEWAYSEGIQLIISLDCGIKSLAEVHRAQQWGIDFIICDHHLPDEDLPKAYSILNPKQRDCFYPFKFLSGCGIAYKLVQAYHQTYKEGILPESLMDLVALSIACDMVEVQDENRILAFHGLKKLNSDPILGIFELVKTCQNKTNSSLEGGISTIRFQDILFQLGPRINAAGRMGNAHRVVNLFTTENESLAQSICQDLDEENQKRREIEKRITQEALELLQKENQVYRFSNVLYCPNWHKGLVGIVASRVIEKHYAPTIILTESQGKITGSARSVGQFNIYDAIQNCSHLLEKFGGHTSAAGLSLSPHKLEDFKIAFEETVEKTLLGLPMKPEIQFHEELELEEITPSFLNVLEQFAPFGPANPVPVFLSRSVKIQKAKKINDAHMKLELKRKNEDLIAMGFGLSDLWDSLENPECIDFCYHIEWNTFRGQNSIQLIIKDIKASPW